MQVIGHCAFGRDIADRAYHLTLFYLVALFYGDIFIQSAIAGGDIAGMFDLHH